MREWNCIKHLKKTVITSFYDLLIEEWSYFKVNVVLILRIGNIDSKMRKEACQKPEEKLHDWLTNSQKALSSCKYV